MRLSHILRSTTMRSMPTVMQKNFANIPAPQIRRSKFDLSHGHKSSGVSGLLYPFFVEEVLPGDTFSVQSTVLARLASLEKPLMDNIYCDTFYFFVPNRLVWENWEKFLGAEVNPGDYDPEEFEVPIIDLGTGSAITYDFDSLQCHMGMVPPQVAIAQADAIISLPCRGYNRIWAEWFRSEDLQDSPSLQMGNGPESNTNFIVLPRGKRHDYFTSCLPFPQKGEAQAIPVSTFTDVAVIGTGKSSGFVNDDVSPSEELVLAVNDSSPYLFFSEVTNAPNAGDSVTISSDPPDAGGRTVGYHTDPVKSGLKALTGALSTTAITINQLREAFAVQQILEAEARGGTRYVEWLRNIFGTISPDYRLQRTEYLGGGSQRVDISQVEQTSESTTESKQANLAGYGIGMAGSGFTKSFVEHGWIIGILNFRTDITYQQGIRRCFSRRTKYDFYMPPLAHLGEQAVLQKEICYSPGLTPPLPAPNDVFGYQERWAEYRYHPSWISGILNSQGSTPIDSWHLSKEFDLADPPVLNEDFIIDTSNVEIARAVSVPSEPHFIYDVFIKEFATRAMPIYSVPGLQRL